MSRACKGPATENLQFFNYYKRSERVMQTEKQKLMSKEFELDAKVRAYREEGDDGTAEFIEGQLRHVQARLYGWRFMRRVYLKEEVDPNAEKTAECECDGKIFDSPSAELVYRAKQYAKLHKTTYDNGVDAVMADDPDLAHCYEYHDRYIW
jgi:hypothetical protein